jgi:anti-sigma factor RsiW
MFNCKESIHSLLEYVEGELSESQALELQEHLRACPPCVDFMRTYRATPQLARRALVNEMPSELASKLKAFLRTKLSPK